MDAISSFIESYGYIAIFVSALIEGEPVIILGGMSAMAGLIPLWVVIASAALGAYVGDITYFYMGRYGGNYAHRRFPHFMGATKKPIELVTRYPRFFSFALRFMYGFRNIMPLCIGVSTIPTSIFFVWNAVGSLVWAIVVAGAGYIAGDILNQFFHSTSGMYVRIIIIMLVIFAIVSPFYHLVRGFKRKHVCTENSAASDPTFVA